ncbi:hypothetical protein ACFPOB_04160 [Bosea eneae]|uniref:Uncharacterized protein n=1 Tax=Bosea eneae TaxID=151454 RepID=A0ABW0IKF1_9HYPH
MREREHAQALAFNARAPSSMTVAAGEDDAAYRAACEKVGTGFSQESCSEFSESITFMILNRLDPKSS